MAKFDLKKLSASSQSIKKDIDNTEKNRIIESKSKETHINTEKNTDSIEEAKAEKNTEFEQTEEITYQKQEIPSESSKNNNIEDNKEANKDSEVKEHIEDSKLKDIKNDIKLEETSSTTEKNTDIVEETKKQVNFSVKDISENDSTLKVASFTLPTEVKNYLKIKPKLDDITITSFLHDLIAAKQKEYTEKGIDITKNPDFANMADIKTRSKGSKPSIVPVKITEDQLKWLKRASLYHGMNISQYIEVLIREEMSKQNL